MVDEDLKYTLNSFIKSFKNVFIKQGSDLDALPINLSFKMLVLKLYK